MTGKNRHYIPRFYQGYFLSCTDPSISYKKKEFHYYLSLIMKGDRNEEIEHTKGKDYFEKSGQEDFGLNLKNDNIITTLENIEVQHFKQMHDWIINKNKSISDYDYNLFFEKCIWSLYIRSITSTNKLRLIINTMIEKLLKKYNGFYYFTLKYKLEKIFLKDESVKNNEKTNFCKQVYNIIVENNLEKLKKQKIFNFNYCEVIQLDFNLPLTDIILLHIKKGSISVVEDINSCNNLIFLFNKKTLLYYGKKENVFNKKILKSLYNFLIINAKDFVITEKKINSNILKKMEKFEIKYDKFYEELEEFIGNLISGYILSGNILNESLDEEIISYIEKINFNNIYEK